ncbi:FlgD immunoglobulin-like domain containing protein [Puniceicoccus vermicola]|uniref:FlgD/Vpr Ig-like domain-containing protein n=1 Tax=Puniceicoccus vermicola TaxID=388746 RepID=A0A7X1B293_9BACT|nr:FlgD immunoglobulin-like domain containing protein [Puniceicoccus vermicola]MBC2604315.1 hypothetical protein [Puniceicoccus vermicola]
MKRYSLACVFAAFIPAEMLASSIYLPLSTGATPEVAYAVEPLTDRLEVKVRVEPLVDGFPAPKLSLGVAAQEDALLESEKDAAVKQTGDGKWEYVFKLPVSLLGAKPAESVFHWAMSVDWLSPSGESALRQNYFVPSDWASFRDIRSGKAQWDFFSTPAFLHDQDLNAQRIRFTFMQAMKGKASIVIEDENGDRVRNLVSGLDFDAGAHEIVWDGLDEKGSLVPFGTYSWRAISHPGITPEYLMHFYIPGHEPWAHHNWLADHSNPTSAASYGKHIVLGAPVAESGNNIVLTDLDGNKLCGVNLSSFIGLGHVFLALGPDRIYAFTEGSPHYNGIRKNEEGIPSVYGDLSLVSWDYTGKQQRYGGANGEHLVRTYYRPMDDPAVSVRTRNKVLLLDNLRGAVWFDGKLYISLHDENKIAIFDAATRQELGAIAVPSPGPIATNGDAIYILGDNDRGLYRINQPGVGAQADRLFTVHLSEPLPNKKRDGSTWPVAAGLAVNSLGEVCLSDNGVDQNLKLYAEDGTNLREIGPRGGRDPSGPWVADAILRPHGIVYDTMDRLWLTENLATPKRVSLWDTNSGKVLDQVFGPPPYGGTGACFDPEDATHWLGGGSSWRLDFENKTADIVSVLNPDLADERLQLIYESGRTFLLAKGRTLRVYEVSKDGSARLWATLGSLQDYEIKEPRWSVPEVFTRHPALREELNDFTRVLGEHGDLRNSAKMSPKAARFTVLWVDSNADGKIDVDELQVSKPTDPQLIIPYWTARQRDLNLDFLVKDDRAGWLRGALLLNGFLPTGAPKWNLEEAYSNAVPVKDFVQEAAIQSTMTDRAGRLLVNTSPMSAIAPNGDVLWSLKNAWCGVHGSQNAPLPVPGVMQGNLGFIGSAPFDDQGDITVLNGNHGRFHILTTDGIYLDDFFEDIRVALSNSPYKVGGEAFGGYFAKDMETGRFLLQAGKGGYRIYQMHGLDQLIRSSGDLFVSESQIVAAQKLIEADAAQATNRKSTSFHSVPSDVDLGDHPGQWPGGWSAVWGDSTRTFPYVRVKIVRQGDDLLLGYDVKDPSPWLNQGTATNLLFKTGDAVDFQFSTDPSANSARRDPVPGDKRLLIANYQDEPVAVLYDFKVPGTRDPVLFNSPWRSTRVDRVEAIPQAHISVKKASGGYRLIARIPLADLGLLKGLGEPFLADFGVIYGDPEGHSNVLRSYWSNTATGLVNDVPGETQINPSLWGTLRSE